MSSSELDRLIKEACKNGWELIRSKNHIILCYTANGRKISIARTASDHRAILNIKSAMTQAQNGMPARHMRNR